MNAVAAAAGMNTGVQNQGSRAGDLAAPRAAHHCLFLTYKDIL